MSTVQLPSSDYKAVDTSSVDGIIEYIRPIVEYLVFEPAKEENGRIVYPMVNNAYYSSIYNALYNITTSRDRANAGNEIYDKLKGLLKSITETLYTNLKEGGDVEGEDLLKRFLAASARFEDRARKIDRMLGYFNRHYVRREEDEGRGVRNVDVALWARPDGEKDEGNAAATSAAKAASLPDQIAPIGETALRCWRIEVVEKIGVEKLVASAKGLKDDADKAQAKELRLALWASGVVPTSQAAEDLNTFIGDRPAPAPLVVATPVPDATSPVASSSKA